jgi:superoxide reductase
MAKRNEIYRCNVCGNIVEVLHAGAGNNLVCCQKPMILLKENSIDASKEKHVPVIEETKEGILVKVGSEPHPMEDKHYIEWIEVIHGEKVFRKFLKPKEKPEAEFPVSPENILVREFCNLHGLWRNK